jgi:pimeloyl-ACP methyl ester carboxylesterase
MAKKLADQYTVFIVDQRNHGKSPHTDEFNYDLLSEDLLNFMYENHIFNTHLLGHSMGGKVVMQFATEHSDMVNKLIVADIAPVQYPAGHDAIFDALCSVKLSDVTSRQEVDEQLQKKIDDFSVRQFLMKGLTRKEDKSFTWKYNLVSLENNYESVLDTFKDGVFEGPTLFIKGANSKYIQERNFPKMKAHFPNYVLKTIENAGHWLHAEQPEAFLQSVLDFLNE